MEMLLDFLNDYIVLIVAGICLGVGFLIKYTVPGEKINRFIPLIVVVLGIFVNMWVNNFTFSPEILLGGIVSGLVSTGGYELVKQFIKLKGEQ